MRRNKIEFISSERLSGVLAAPLAALLAGKLSKKVSYLLIGILTVIWSLKILIPLI
jgi:hypothetical protein